jgi:Inner membrane component of T3SS, cytoplasmic domain
MTTDDAQTPTGLPDRVRTGQLLTGPDHAAREAVVSADAAAGRECEVPSLVIISGRHRGRRIPVPSTGIVLGREGGLAPFFRDDPLVSRGHAQVYVVGDRSVQVADLNSTNGTFVNGEAISSLTRLAGQDVLRIGSIEMRLDPPGTGAQPADESLRWHDIRASWPDPPAGRRAPPEHRRREGRPGFLPAAAWPNAQAGAGNGPAEAGPGAIGSSSGQSPGPADQEAPPSSSAHDCETPHALTRRGPRWLPAAGTRPEWRGASFWTGYGQSALR